MNESTSAKHPIDTAAEIISDLSRQLTTSKAEPKVGKYLDAAPFVVLRDGEGSERVEYVTEIMEGPHRKTGKVPLDDAKSFIAYYDIHGNGAPVYAQLDPAQFVAVLNDHTKTDADWRDHRAIFKVGHSREWEIWTKHNGANRPFGSTEEFALFLEDNAPDIIDPSPADMLGIALNFRVNADVQFSVANRLQDGHVELGYKNLVSASSGNYGTIGIPEQFSIEVPVFQGLDASKYHVDARFRYRLRDGKLTLWYELVRPHKVVEQAFKDIWVQIDNATGATILLGSPE